MVILGSAGSGDAHAIQIVVDDLENEIAVTDFKSYEVVLAVRVVRFIEVFKRGDLMQRDCFDHVR